MSLLDRVAAFWEKVLPERKPRRRLMMSCHVTSLDDECVFCWEHTNDHDIIIPGLVGRCRKPT